MKVPQPLRRPVCATFLVWALLLGCATPVASPKAVTMVPTDVPAALAPQATTRWLLLGEQHDADAHQALHRATVEHLARSGRLAALVLEMAERGRDTRGLPADATDAQVQAALRWDDTGWPWARYGPTVMAAVRAGLPVWGGNQPRADMRAAMSDPRLEQAVTADALARHRENIRVGHCNLLPEGQLTPMARIQIARDRAMAETLLSVAHASDGRVAVLVAGTEHVRRDLGVPVHLGANAAASQVVVMHSGPPDAAAGEGADQVWLTAPTPAKDHCAELRQRWGR